MLVAKGYPDIGWNPVEGERYLDFLRFAVFCNGRTNGFWGPLRSLLKLHRNSYKIVMYASIFTREVNIRKETEYFIIRYLQ